MFKPPEAAVTSLVRLLYTQNPFYLIGTFLILFGLQQCLGSEPTLATSGSLIAIVAAYTLLLAAIAALVIRWGQVWDDARTILLVIVLLFFMLSTSLDYHLIETPLAGMCLLGGGLVFSVLVSEGLLRGLRIGLAAQYRGPYYLILALLFLYPVALAWLGFAGWYGARTWAIFAFPSAAGLALLTLLPAARTPARREPATSTPWPWPFYPWSLFVYLTIGLAIRAWWLTIAFETAKGVYFRPYFLLPLVLAWSALVLEMGKVRRSHGAVAAGLALPILGLAFAFPGPAHSGGEITLYWRLAETIGSPPQLAVGSLLLFYGWAWLRRVRAAEGFLIALGVLASVVGRHTLDWDTLTPPQPLPLAVVGGALLLTGLRRESTWHALAGAVVSVAAAKLGAPVNVDAGGLWFWQCHAPVLAMLAAAALFNDRLAHLLRELGWRAAPVLAIVATAVYPWTWPGLGELTLSAYLALVLLLSLGLWVRQKEVAALAAAVGTLAANLLAHARQLYMLLDQTLLAEGLPWLAGGLIVVALALGISLLKMGFWGRAWQVLARVNLALRGPDQVPT